MEKDDQHGLHISVIFILLGLQYLFGFSEAVFLLLVILYSFFFYVVLMKKGVWSREVAILIVLLVFLYFFK
ncbi:hypothetical protein [Bacillus marinisedimentorum]|uniref:hypothetical protein n=1 Tax=Bacillus marinisedimentorum TaxID=1821260 RepID=UPI000AD05AD3|nr:hypothetical protein [Bacillus marinisedimentorum]